MTLLTDVQSVGKITEDIERLYCEKTYLDEMSWIVSAIDNAYLNALLKKSQKSRYAARFVKLKEYHEQRIKDLQENLWNAESKENDNDGKSLAERYSEAKTVTKKKTNTVRNQRRGKRRRRAETSGSALLEEVRHPKVREFAMR